MPVVATLLPSGPQWTTDTCFGCGPVPLGAAVAPAVSMASKCSDNADRYYLTPAAVARTMFIDTDHISSTDFHLTAEQRQTLYADGQQAARDWLAARSAPA